MFFEEWFLLLFFDRFDLIFLEWLNFFFDFLFLLDFDSSLLNFFDIFYNLLSILIIKANL